MGCRLGAGLRDDFRGVDVFPGGNVCRGAAQGRPFIPDTGRLCTRFNHRGDSDHLTGFFHHVTEGAADLGLGFKEALVGLRSLHLQGLHRFQALMNDLKGVGDRLRLLHIVAHRVDVMGISCCS